MEINSKNKWMDPGLKICNSICKYKKPLKTDRDVEASKFVFR